MPSRFSNAPYDVGGSHVSVLTPADEEYRTDAENYGVDEPAGRWIVGIGPDHPDVVLVGSREQLAAVAADILTKLG